MAFLWCAEWMLRVVTTVKMDLRSWEDLIDMEINEGHRNEKKHRLFFFQLINFSWRIITKLWWLFPYINMNQSQVYMCPPILKPPPTFFPILSLWVVPMHRLCVPCFIYQPCTGHHCHHYMWWYTCFNVILSNHPTLTFFLWVQKPVLYICVSFATLHVGSSELSF